MNDYEKIQFFMESNRTRFEGVWAKETEKAFTVIASAIRTQLLKQFDRQRGSNDSWPYYSGDRTTSFRRAAIKRGKYPRGTGKNRPLVKVSSAATPESPVFFLSGLTRKAIEEKGALNLGGLNLIGISDFLEDPGVFNELGIDDDTKAIIIYQAKQGRDCTQISRNTMKGIFTAAFLSMFKRIARQSGVK